MISNLDPIVAIYYNANMLTPDEWKKESNPNLYLGLAFFIFGFPFQLLFIPALWAITKPQFQKMCTYKILLALAIVDCLESVIAVEFQSYLTIVGSNFGMNPKLIYYGGMFSMGGWNCSCALNVLLCFSRIIDIYKPKIADFLFDGYKTLIWIFLCFVYFFMGSFFSRPGLYTSQIYSWVFNPFFQIDEINSQKYAEFYQNKLHIFNNVIVFILLVPMNIILLKLLFIQTSKMSNQDANILKLKRNMIFQSTVICGITTLVSFMYLILDKVPVPILFSVAANFLWQANHLNLPFVLCFMNLSVRKCIKAQLFGCAVVNKVTIVPGTLTNPPKTSIHHAKRLY
uniref:Serpentine Receptor, class T n=1 Tax=Rhabditophanes sp. KR3021 TaxID=114890 RepID=A0AC35TX31_9BILA